MTKWQESCITALASSPLAWEAFKMKQRNKKMLWQYINRIWPYKQKSRYINHTINSCKECYNSLFSFLTYIEDIEEHDKNFSSIEDCVYYFPKPTITGDILNTIYEDIHTRMRIELRYNSIGPLGINGNTLFMLKYRGYNNNFADSMDARRNISIIPLLRRLPNSTYVNSIIFCNHINDRKTMCERLIVELNILLRGIEFYIEKLERNSKKEYNYYFLNIGIEIEHDADNPTAPNIQDSILRHNCTSYDSGYDGDNANRLRENRIRLNGINGLKGLHILLEDMKTNTLITKESSVHMHIDCKYDNYRQVSEKYYKYDHPCFNNSLAIDNLKKYFIRFALSNMEALYYLKEIFLFSKVEELRFWDNSNYVKYNEEFDTLEYRFLITNLKYNDYVIQMLTLIHITECAKHNCLLNISYLSILAKVAKKLRE